MKTCILCPTQIKPQHRLCRACYQLYKDQMHEPWFIALVQMERIQARINQQELFSIDLLYCPINTSIKTKRSVGRPAAPVKIIEEVLRLYDESLEKERIQEGERLSLRAIERLMNGRVKYLAVRRILKKYRAHIFPNKVLT